MELKTIQIIVNGNLERSEIFEDEVRFNKDNLQPCLDAAIERLHGVLKDEDFARNGGKRPDKCPGCKSPVAEAGKKELPPYRDWDCTFCGLNGHDGRYNVKD